MNKDIPYIVFEGEVARLERTIKRLVIVVVIAIILLFTSNIAWIWFIGQYDFETTTTSQSAEGNANYIGQDGDITNGGTENEDS